MKGKISLLAGDLRVNNIVRLNNLEYHPEFNGRLCIVQGVQANNANGCVVWLRVAGDLPIHEKIVSNICQLIEYVAPVELTPEILEKCGFERKFNYASNRNSFHVSSKGRDFALEVIDENQWSFYQINNVGMIHRLASLQYLHQLQNLYYTLCGTELNINL